MIVVSNTSPLTNLAAIGLVDLLQLLYRHISIPRAVWDELHANSQLYPGTTEVSTAKWIKVTTVTNLPLVQALRRDLGRGEAEAIALAVQLKADLLLLDEREGRRAAQRQGVRVIGVVGILIAAKAQGDLPSIRSQLDALRHHGFYLSDGVYQHALHLSGEVA